jgi:ABC-type branched-subunit amino acid transport system substrate-binding protein
MREGNKRRLAVVTAVVAVLCSIVVQQSTAGSGADKEPFTIAVAAPINSQIASYPAYFHAAIAWAKSINAGSGLNGHKVKLITCDNQFNPNVTVNCARQAADAGAIAFINQGAVAQNTFDILQNAGIPYLSPIPVFPVETTSPISFVTTVAYGDLTTAEVAVANYRKCKSVFLLYGDLIPALGDAVAAQLQSYGMNVTKVSFPNTSDLAPYLQRATNEDCLLATGMAENVQAGFGQALAQYKGKFKTIIVPALVETVLAQQPTAWEGTYVVNTVNDVTGPGWATFRKQMQKYFPTEVRNPQAQQLYPPLRLLQSVVAYLGQKGSPVTPKTVLQALQSNRKWSLGGVVPDVNFTKLVGSKVEPRLASSAVSIAIAKNGKLTGAFGDKYTSIRQFILGDKVAPGTFGTP